MTSARQRAPWWMFAVGATFCAYFALLAYSAFAGPAGPGILAEFISGRMVIRSVQSDSPAERAGLKPGDQVIAVEGSTIGSRLDWMAVAGNLESAKPLRVEIERGGERTQTEITLNRRDRMSREALIGLLLWAVRLAALILALVIAFNRPGDVLACVGAWFLATAAITSAVVLNGMAATWRQLPAPVAQALLLPALNTFLLAPIFFTFCALFPHGVFRRRWMLAGAWVPGLLPLPWFAIYLNAMVDHPAQASGVVPDWLPPLFAAISLAYLAGGIAALRVNYTRLDSVNERRRTRLLGVGATAGWLAALPLIVLDWWGSAASRTPGFFSSPLAIGGAVLFCLFLLSLAYVILRRRVFDIRVMIRQGLRYALARRLLLSLTPLMAAVLVADLLRHGDRPLTETLRMRGWIYVAVGGLAALAKVRSARWMEALDRRFFRERYDAHRLLQEVVEEIRQARRLERVAPRVVAKIEASLHPEFAALMVRAPGDTSFRVLAVAPSGYTLPPVSGDNKVLALARLLGKPLELSHSQGGWIEQQFPREDADFFGGARVELLAPVVSNPARGEAMLALGSKRSEEPYTDEDRDLIAAIGASLSFLMDLPADERVAETPVGIESCAECPQCGVCYAAGVSRCSREGATLTALPLPRMLAGRYRLERRLGRGGMGTVYEATDTALDRQVAAKVIRDDLINNPDVAERFQREARAAAAFSHPNIVTVHDFGVGGARAFLIMELLQGCTLREELQRLGSLPEARVVEMLRGVCGAVEAAHQRQIIHRDLKPENIFLIRSKGGELAKVLDFGLAKALQTIEVNASATTAGLGTAATVLLGTLKYMAPEQLRGELPQPGWDLWALAVTAYEMLMGAHPFGEMSATECYRLALAGGFVITTYPPDRPPAVRRFFDRAFAAVPEQRPQTAGSFLADLEKSLT